jgi:hypothetical protein
MAIARAAGTEKCESTGIHRVKSTLMTTQLDKTLRRQIRINGQDYIVALSPEGLKLTVKGKRIGLELSWSDLVSGEAALAVALNASVGRFTPPDVPKKAAAKKGTKKKVAKSTRPTAVKSRG